MRRCLLVVVLVASGCARSTASSPDGRAVDAASVDGTPADGAVAQGAQPGAEVVVAGGRVEGASRTIELEIGHWVEQGETAAGSRRMTGAAVVFP